MVDNESLLVDEDQFLEHRKLQETAQKRAVGARNEVMDSLLSVEINPTELCNRQCVFCPRSDPRIYPNRKLHMEVRLAERVADELKANESCARISLSGFGEPLLHPALADVVHAIRSRLPNNTIESNTNGDRLTVERIQKLYDAGITFIYVNCFDGPEQIPFFEERFEKAGIDPSRYRLRKHWQSEENNSDFGLKLNNRSGNVQSDTVEALKPLEEPLELPCYYPFYKMLVDWNGDVLFCSNDWGRKIIIGNILEVGIRELWLSSRMFEIRKRLMHGNREHEPCNTCNVHGTLHGGSSFQQLLKHYVENNMLESSEVPDNTP